MSSIVKSPDARSPRSACCDRIYRVSVIRSVDGGSTSAAPGAGTADAADMSSRVKRRVADVQDEEGV